ncbi:hypothetical protein CSIV_15480 [Microbacterium sp. CSI-V]|uniref:hypothetical protein n=1 Tax=unclassified Microbacterium TaxID=2609290 RepID=UPI00097C1124|nr:MULTISPECIES: hypothetical protein [unclassified Microbacterium]MXS74219.1 hypothetical protein [Microbacterium sp. TL13]ONI62846.1 hypothetical protein CSIV_15480 [Microbacterium sp. CSI-V]
MNVDTAQALIALAAFFVTFAAAILSGMKWIFARMEHRMERRFAESEARWNARFARGESSPAQTFARS